MTGFACAGSNCDSVNLYCEQPVTNVGGVQEPGSNDQLRVAKPILRRAGTFGDSVGLNRFIAGVECNDSYCDNKRFYVCSLEPATNSCEGTCGSQAPDGCWCDSACTGYGDCCADHTNACGA